MSDDRTWTTQKVDMGPEEAEDFSSTPAPAGRYVLAVYESVGEYTREGLPKIVLGYRIVAAYDQAKGDFVETPYHGKRIRFHNITLFKDSKAKGFGITKHNLKSLAQEYQNLVNVAPDNFLGKTIVAQVIIDDEGKYNQVKWIDGPALLGPSQLMQFGVSELVGPLPGSFAKKQERQTDDVPF